MKTLLVNLFFVVLSMTAIAQQQGKYIFMKSGHIEYELTGNTTGTKSVWFDDYGMKMYTLYESTSTVKILGIKKTTVTKELEIRKGNLLWKIDLLKNKGTKTTINYAVEIGKPITKGKTDAQLHEMERKTITDMGANIEGYENILGRKCLVFTLGTTKFWQYKGYPLKSIISVLGITGNEIAISMQENIVVPASKFDVPAGISIEEMVNPLDEGGGLEGLLNGLDKNTQNENNKADDEDEPLRTTLTYNQFVAGLTNVKLAGFKKMITNNEVSTYVSMFQLNGKMGGVSVFNENLFDSAEKGEDVMVQKTYTLNGKPAKYAYTHEGETQMHVLFIKYTAKKMTLMIHAERTIPLSTLEELSRELKY